MERSHVPAHFPTFNRCRRWSRSRRPPRVRITVGRAMTAVAVLGLVCGIVRWDMPESPQVMALRKRAHDHMLQAKVWGRYAKLSEDGKARLGFGLRRDARLENTYGEVLSTPEYACWVRPTDPAKAAEFDRQSATAPARCREMQAYHERLRRKWERAAARPWENVPPDPDPPLYAETGPARNTSD